MYVQWICPKCKKQLISKAGILLAMRKHYNTEHPESTRIPLNAKLNVKMEAI